MNTFYFLAIFAVVIGALLCLGAKMMSDNAFAFFFFSLLLGACVVGCVACIWILVDIMRQC